MSARDLLERAQTTGVKILADNGELVLRGNPSAVDALITEAKAHKAELLDLALRATATKGQGGKSLPGDPAPAQANDTEDEPLPDPQAEARRQHVLAMLGEQPGTRIAVLTDTEADPEAVILALAIRGQATCEFRIPRDKYDGLLLLDLIERHGATMH